MNVSETLNRAADHMAAFGKFEGAPGIGEGPIATAPGCAIGCINIVSCDERGHVIDSLSRPAQEALRAYLGGLCVPDWSDSTPAEEVVATLRSCALVEAAKAVDVCVVAPAGMAVAR